MGKTGEKVALQDVLFTNRVSNPNLLLQDDNIKATLLVLGVAAIATAGIGRKFFEMDKMTASVVGGSGTMLAASAVTERDAFLCILATAYITGTGVAMVQAFRDGRFYVKVDLADLLRLAYDISQKK